MTSKPIQRGTYLKVFWLLYKYAAIRPVLHSILMWNIHRDKICACPNWKKIIRCFLVISSFTKIERSWKMNEVANLQNWVTSFDDCESLFITQFDLPSFCTSICKIMPVETTKTTVPTYYYTSFGSRRLPIDSKSQLNDFRVLCKDNRGSVHIQEFCALYRCIAKFSRLINNVFFLHSIKITNK